MPYPKPTYSDCLDHYTALKNSPSYLPISHLEESCIYMIHARNSYLGIWDGAAKGFVILREKLGEFFLFIEYHWDTGEPYGTAKPFVKLRGPVANENRRKALDEALTVVPYEQFVKETRAFLK